MAKMFFYPLHRCLLLFLSWSTFVCVFGKPPVDTTVCKPFDSLDFSPFVSNKKPIDLYYINLARRTDREANIQSEFKLHGIVPPRFTTHRFEAVDGKSYKLSPQEEATFATFNEKGLGNKENSGVLKANSLSHLGVWRKVAESNVPFAIVVQDDVQFKNCFLEDLLEVLEYNPADALVTWIGLNAFADGPVSRSATLSRNKYDPNYFSKELEKNSGGVIGIARKGYSATGSLAYILTRAGANALIDHFMNGPGWTHHTDHAMVEFLDSKQVSYISRNILATTYDDGLFGSDIFPTKPTLLSEYERIERLVEVACAMPDLLNTVESASRLQAIASQTPSPIIKNNVTKDIKVRCEESSCMNPGCPNTIQITVYLSWPSTNQVAPEQKRLNVFKPAREVTAADILDVLPASWTLEFWASGADSEQSMHFPRPRFKVGDHVQCLFTSNPQEALLESESHRFEEAVVAMVGYRDESWAAGLYVTYVVQMADGRLLTLVVDDARIRAASNTASNNIPGLTSSVRVAQDGVTSEKLEFI